MTIQQKVTPQQREEAGEPIEYIPAKPQPQAGKLSAETEELLAAIDDLLEENAQEFVDSFVQQSGQ